MQQLGEFVVNHWELFIPLAVILGLLAKSYIGPAGVKLVRSMEAIQLINSKRAVILDVRLENEFKEGHIINAIHIPLGHIRDRIKELEKFKQRPIIVNCRTGNDSSKACSILRKQGFEMVHKLNGGIHAWQNANLPLEKK